MGAVTITQMAGRVASLMEERLGIPGEGLEAKLQRGGRRLTPNVRAAAEALAMAAQKAQNPKLLLQVDEGQVAQDYDTCVRHLTRLPPHRATLSVAASVTISLLAVATGVVAYLAWRGYL